MKYLIPILMMIAACTRERSCEGCIEVKTDTIPVIDTPKNYFVRFDVYVPNNNEISHIEVQVKRKPDPFFWTFYIMNHVDDSVSYRYTETYDRTFIYSGITDTLIK